MAEQESTGPEQEQSRGSGPSTRASKVPMLVVLAIAAIFLWQIRDMRVGTLTEPGPAFWPLILVVVMAITGVVGLLTDVTAGVEEFDSSTLRVGAGFVVLASFILLFPFTGVILAGFVFMVAWLRLLHGESWRLTLILAALAPLAAYLLFVTLLGVRFPDDLVASLWGGR